MRHQIQAQSGWAQKMQKIQQQEKKQTNKKKTTCKITTKNENTHNKCINRRKQANIKPILTKLTIFLYIYIFL